MACIGADLYPPPPAATSAESNTPTAPTTAATTEPTNMTTTAAPITTATNEPTELNTPTAPITTATNEPTELNTPTAPTTATIDLISSSEDEDSSGSSSEEDSSGSSSEDDNEGYVQKLATKNMTPSEERSYYVQKFLIEKGGMIGVQRLIWLYHMPQRKVRAMLDGHVTILSEYMFFMYLLMNSVVSPTVLLSEGPPTTPSEGDTRPAKKKWLPKGVWNNIFSFIDLDSVPFFMKGVVGTKEEIVEEITSLRKNQAKMVLCLSGRTIRIHHREHGMKAITMPKQGQQYRELPSSLIESHPCMAGQSADITTFFKSGKLAMRSLCHLRDEGVESSYDYFSLPKIFMAFFIAVLDWDMPFRGLLSNRFAALREQVRKYSHCVPWLQLGTALYDCLRIAAKNGTFENSCFPVKKLYENIRANGKKVIAKKKKLENLHFGDRRSTSKLYCEISFSIDHMYHAGRRKFISFGLNLEPPMDGMKGRDIVRRLTKAIKADEFMQMVVPHTRNTMKLPPLDSIIGEKGAVPEDYFLSYLSDRKPLVSHWSNSRLLEEVFKYRDYENKTDRSRGNKLKLAFRNFVPSFDFRVIRWRRRHYDECTASIRKQELYQTSTLLPENTSCEIRGKMNESIVGCIMKQLKLDREEIPVEQKNNNVVLRLDPTTQVHELSALKQSHPLRHHFYLRMKPHPLRMVDRIPCPEHGPDCVREQVWRALTPVYKKLEEELCVVTMPSGHWETLSPHYLFLGDSEEQNRLWMYYAVLYCFRNFLWTPFMEVKAIELPVELCVLIRHSWNGMSFKERQIPLHSTDPLVRKYMESAFDRSLVVELKDDYWENALSTERIRKEAIQKSPVWSELRALLRQPVRYQKEDKDGIHNDLFESYWGYITRSLRPHLTKKAHDHKLSVAVRVGSGRHISRTNLGNPQNCLFIHRMARSTHEPSLPVAELSGETRKAFYDHYCVRHGKAGMLKQSDTYSCKGYTLEKEFKMHGTNFRIIGMVVDPTNEGRGENCTKIQFRNPQSSYRWCKMKPVAFQKLLASLPDRLPALTRFVLTERSRPTTKGVRYREAYPWDSPCYAIVKRNDYLNIDDDLEVYYKAHPMALLDEAHYDPKQWHLATLRDRTVVLKEYREHHNTFFCDDRRKRQRVELFQVEVKGVQAVQGVQGASSSSATSSATPFGSSRMVASNTVLGDFVLDIFSEGLPRVALSLYVEDPNGRKQYLGYHLRLERTFGEYFDTAKKVVFLRQDSPTDDLHSSFALEYALSNFRLGVSFPPTEDWEEDNILMEPMCSKKRPYKELFVVEYEGGARKLLSLSSELIVRIRDQHMLLSNRKLSAGTRTMIMSLRRKMVSYRYKHKDHRIPVIPIHFMPVEA